MGPSGLTCAAVRPVPTQQAYRSNIADVELESDNPPLTTPHDHKMVRNEVILLQESLPDLDDVTEPAVHSQHLPVTTTTRNLMHHN